MSTRKSAGIRPGFTIIELMYALTISGMLMVFAYPHVQSLVAANSLDSSKRYVRTYLNTARATAIQRGRPAQLIIRRDTLSVRADTLGNGSFVTVLGPVSLAGTFSVSVSATTDSIAYSPRGFATNLPGAGAKIVIARPEQRDSVCVSPIGPVLAGC